MLGDILSTGASVLGNVAGSIINSQAAKKAAKLQAGAQEAADLKRQEALKQVQSLQAPGVAAYYTGLNALTGRLGLPGQAVTSAIDSQTAQRAPFDPQQFLKDHPDVMAAYQAASPSNLKNNLHIDATPEAYATWFYNTQGKYDPSYQMPIVSSPITGTTAAGQAGGQPISATLPAMASGGALPTGATGATPAQMTGEPGTYGNAANPSYTTPDPFSYTAADYHASPAYQYTVDQAMKGVTSATAANGSLMSGATLKALQDRAANLANQDFGNERNFAYGNYTDRNNLLRSNYENDRNYLTNRYDQGTNDLFRYTGVGQNALTATSNADQGYGSDAAQTQLNYGDIAAGNALQQGSIWSGLTSNLAGMASSGLSGLGSGTNLSPAGVQTSGQVINRAATVNPNQQFRPLPSFTY